jgi:hypothetical protein
MRAMFYSRAIRLSLESRCDPGLSSIAEGREAILVGSARIIGVDLFDGEIASLDLTRGTLGSRGRIAARRSFRDSSRCLKMGLL